MSSVSPTPRSSQLDSLIAETTVDCYNEAEAIVGFLTMMQDNLVVPFKPRFWD
jgi:hypothetical protein